MAQRDAAMPVLLPFVHQGAWRGDGARGYGATPSNSSPESISIWERRAQLDAAAGVALPMVGVRTCRARAAGAGSG